MRAAAPPSYHLETVFYAGDPDSPRSSVTGKPVNYNEIKKEYNASKLFEDADFPPTKESLGPLDGDTAAGAAGKTECELYWIRPHEICKSNGIEKPYFVITQDEEEDKSPFSESDLKQGGIGDCWYIAALQALITRPNHLRNVIPKDNYNGFEDDEYCGAFHFRFYDMDQSKWIDLVVDDLLPCKKEGEVYTPAFAKFTSKFKGATVAEFWPALIEKAFAKFVGNYGRIEGGFMNQAMCTFTGGYPEMYFVRPPRENKYEFFKSRIEACMKSEGFVGLMTHAVQNACDKGCLEGYSHYEKCLDETGVWTGDCKLQGYKKNPETGAPDVDTTTTGFGLLGPHAYTAIGARKLSTKDGSKSYFLIQVRNPHAAHEWTGKFGDSDDATWALMEEDLRTQNKAGSKEIDDGVFWIELNDVIEFFYMIDFCYPKGVKDARHLANIQSEWPASVHGTSIDATEDPTAEFAVFPTFKFVLKPKHEGTKCTAAMTLVLNDYHVLLTPTPYFRFWVYKVDEADLESLSLADMYVKQKPVIESPGRQGRDASGLLEEAEPGTYILTAGLLTSPVEGTIVMPQEFMGKAVKFSVRIFTEVETTIEQFSPKSD